jgi:hypothetical protein
MQKNLACIRLLLGVGISQFLLWFLIFCFSPQKILAAISLPENGGMFLRLYRVLPLAWAILFLFALKDIGKNIAIINA